MDKILRGRNYSLSDRRPIVLGGGSTGFKKIEMRSVEFPIAPDMSRAISCVNRLASPGRAPERPSTLARTQTGRGPVVAKPNDKPYPLWRNGFGDHRGTSRGTVPSAGHLRDYCPVSPSDEGRRQCASCDDGK